MILNLSSFIYSLLLENETVIIPGFGAFVSTYKPAEILENEIKPPSKEISFTQQIKNNDGMLAEIIARKAKISQSYAMKRIEKARENMLYELDKGETVVIENIGTLVYNEKNEIQFTAFHDENMLVESFGFETVSKKDAIQRTDEKENWNVIIEEQKEKAEEIQTEQVSEQISEEEKESKTEAVFSPAVENKEKLTYDEIPLKEKEPDRKSVGGDESQNKRKKFAWYWYMLILIPVFLGGIFMLTNKSKTSETVIDKEEISYTQQHNIQSETTVPVDSVEDKSAETIESGTETHINPTELTSTNETSKFYIVGGGFKDEDKVEKFILKLKEKGINGFSLGQKGSLYLVGIDTFDNENDAQESLNKLVKANPGWNLWIYKK